MKTHARTRKRRAKRWATRDGQVTLYLGDVLDVLPTLRCDIIVTSPPYNILGRIAKQMPSSRKLGNGSFIKKCRLIGYEDDLPEDIYRGWLTSVVRECIKRAKGAVWINHKMRYHERRGIHPLRMLPFEVFNEIIWHRGDSLDWKSERFPGTHEHIYGFGQPHWWNMPSKTHGSVWKLRRELNAEHPCAFPLDLPRRLIEASCPPAGVVCDPFSGSGTTGVAAVELGRRYIGIEKSPEFFAASIARIKVARQALRKAA